MSLFKKPLVKYSFVFLVIVFLFFSPWIFTHPYLFEWESMDFSDTGSIGDTIGGITSPFIGLISIFLLYLTLKEQIRINHEQKKFNDATRILSMETFISQMANNICFGYSSMRGIEEGRGLKDVLLLNKTLYNGVGIAEGEFINLYGSIRTLDNSLSLMYNLLMSNDSELEYTQKRFVANNLLYYYKTIFGFYQMVSSSNIEIFPVYSDTKQVSENVSMNDLYLHEVNQKIEGLRTYEFA